MIIRSKAPLRLGFAGGGTDVAPFCEIYGGCVLNVTINMYSYCTIIPRDDNKIIFHSPDLGINVEYDNIQEFEIDKVLPLHKGIYNHIVKNFNNGEKLGYEMTTYSDAPSGSGLGTSSTMVVTILKAFVEWLNLPLGEYDIAKLAFKIERNELKFSGGAQDQYAATFGGLNFMEFYSDNKVIVNPLRLKESIKNEMENSLVLFYTGKSHDSSKIIEEQKKSTSDKKSKNFEGMLEIKASAYKMKEYVLTGNFEMVSDTLNKAWEAKKKTSKAISNPMIDELYNFAIKNGAKAAKISGAGGGGFMMCLVEPSRRYSFVQALESRKDGKVQLVDFADTGAESWKIYGDEDCGK